MFESSFLLESGYFSQLLNFTHFVGLVTSGAKVPFHGCPGSSSGHLSFFVGPGNKRWVNRGGFDETKMVLLVELVEWRFMHADACLEVTILVTDLVGF